MYLRFSGTTYVVFAQLTTREVRPQHKVHVAGAGPVARDVVCLTRHEVATLSVGAARLP